MSEIKSLEGLHLIRLPMGGSREEIDRLLEPDFIDSVGSRAHDMLGNVEGFELIEKSDPNRPEFRCVQYVFTKKREPWAKEDERIDIFTHPLNFLTGAGYKPIRAEELPGNGDIIAYGFTLPKDPLFKLMHMGIMDRDKVLSKFNEGHVFRHPMNAIPHHFGSNALIFRK